MGAIIYDSDQLEFKIEDRLLAHLQIVIINKFRKGESFVFSWKDSLDTGDGRATIWLSPNIGLRFRFAGSRGADINPSWLAALYEAADSGRGLYAVPEPARDDDTVLPGVTGDPVDRANQYVPPKNPRRARPPAA
jgi:hypothetical protein